MIYGLGYSIMSLRSDNYPDDIRNYDNHPSSPFYVEPPICEVCGEYIRIVEDYDGEQYYKVQECDCD